MGLLNWLKNYRDKLEAEIRHEKNIGKPGERGRIFTKVDVKPTITARVYRAATNKWEDLGELKQK